MSSVLLPDLLPSTTAPTSGSSARCHLCDGSGWADPWEVHDGAPMLTWCGAWCT